ncbi:alpha-N-acetylgalactosaminide alpha-2,6-sialyltransferase 5b isoform X2 [Engraulis encrasicolus]|uniref:alpha-N-acetylgalactosaminide alpha-2,6-sialyltransferase 5b isoform X2 n=1 Tax=Engraulis encrasicolus TaxID=184585 RepID=UPI002FD47E44
MWLFTLKREHFLPPLSIQPLRMHCNSCSLVTSSGHLMGGERGGQIDQSDCVIRMNDAPSQGHERDVGQRTTLRVIAHSSLDHVLRNRQPLLQASPDTVFVFWGPSILMSPKGGVYKKLVGIKRAIPKLKVYTISQAKMAELDTIFKEETGMDRKMSQSWLSTGWFTMILTIELCDTIEVYGMVSPDFCQQPATTPAVPYHYYGASKRIPECAMYLSHERGKHGGHHRFITEKRVYAKWAQTFDIHFHQPDWEPELPVQNQSNGTASRGS